MGVELPDWLGNAGSVSIDEKFGAWVRFILLGCEASQMQFADCLDWQAVDIPIGVVVHIMGAEIHVADVAQELASGSTHKLTEEFELAHRRRVETHIARGILYEIEPSQALLDLVDMCRDQAQRFLVVWQWQKVVEIFALVRGPREVT